MQIPGLLRKQFIYIRKIHWGGGYGSSSQKREERRCDVLL